MKITRNLLNRVEGEVELKLIWENGVVKDAFICAPNYRGFEKILEGRPYLDALAITPRVCGICGHAHLIATSRAIEDAYRKAGIDIKLSQKAKAIRSVTLLSEIVQNHIRWFYLYLLPDVIKLKPSLRELYEPLKGTSWNKALEMSNKIIKVIALFGGQWPHTSYSLPGGVMCDPTGVEINQAVYLVNELIDFFEKNVLEMSKDRYLSIRGKDYINEVGGDIARFIELCLESGLDRAGRSYGRFLAGGGIEPCFLGGTYTKRVCKFDVKKVRELEDYSFFSGNGKGYTWAKAVRYQGLPYETGPLARQIVSRNSVIRYLFKEYGDSTMVRVIARIDEAFRLLLNIRETLLNIDLKEVSWIKPNVDHHTFNGSGIGVIEAARGTLIHQIDIKNGRIKSYNIITPTVWNLGPRDDANLGVVEKAIIGLDSELKAHIVLRSFDVCSVCTSH